ncbi:MAG: GNAT family N-acetyltransferase [Clostridia bacterium]|nr:GNAT family N-acetyltransferase [Clostridia bacterium]
MFEYRKATEQDMESIWNRSIADHPGDSRWVKWKEQYIAYHQSGRAATFVAVCDGCPVGEGTLLFSAECGAIRGRTVLADNRCIANVNALRIQKEYEGQGHISAMMRRMEDYAIKQGYTRLTIGVEAKETRNLAIYLHWGYDEFIMSETEDDELVLYYAKKINQMG